MIINTQNNHLKYWYNDNINERWRKSWLDTTSMEVGGCERKCFSTKIEWIRNCTHIMKNYPDLTLFMSGGLDSEIALRSFLAAGFNKINLKTVRFPNGANEYDIGPMLEMTKAMGLSVEIVDFDPEDFYLSGEWEDISAKYQAYTFYQQILLKVAELHNAPMITIDEIELEKRPCIDWDTGKSFWSWNFIKKEDQDGTWRRFSEKTGIPALNNFYTYTPESMLSFLQLPTVTALINDKIPGKLGWTSSKMRIYAEAGYNFRPRPKYHGMENYMHIWSQVESNPIEELSDFTPVIYTINALKLMENLKKGKPSLCQVLN